MKGLLSKKRARTTTAPTTVRCTRESSTLAVCDTYSIEFNLILICLLGFYLFKEEKMASNISTIDDTSPRFERVNTTKLIL